MRANWSDIITRHFKITHVGVSMGVVDLERTSTMVLEVDVRLISATNVDLKDAVVKGDFQLINSCLVFLTLQVTTAQDAHVMQFVSGNDVSQRANGDINLVCLSLSQPLRFI